VDGASAVELNGGASAAGGKARIEIAGCHVEFQKGRDLHFRIPRSSHVSMRGQPPQLRSQRLTPTALVDRSHRYQLRGNGVIYCATTRRQRTLAGGIKVG